MPSYWVMGNSIKKPGLQPRPSYPIATALVGFAEVCIEYTCIILKPEQKSKLFGRLVGGREDVGLAGIKLTLDTSDDPITGAGFHLAL